jgi:hypothetical protein
LSLACLVGLLPVSQSRAAITVEIGPTPIPRGDARGEKDITVNNGLFAISLAVDTAPPWGVARGGIVDIAIVRDGEPGYDIASLADFMPNNWSSWPTSYQRVSIVRHTAGEVVIRTERDWGKVELETLFTIRDRDSRIRIETSMRNLGESTLEGLLSGYVVWPDGGYLFGVPGLHGKIASAEDEALADWSAAYDEDWALGLHAPYAQFVSYGGRDRYLPHDLKAGESRSFEAWLQIEPGGSLAPLVAAEIAFRGVASGKVSGQVRSASGDQVRHPALVVLRNGKPYTWAIGKEGRYEISLPVGRYELYATAAAHGRSASRTITVEAGGELRENFDDVAAPARVSFRVAELESGEPMDARISIKRGYKPLIEYFGKKTFFTELDRVGLVDSALAPGEYEFAVSAGGGFTSVPLPVTQELKAGGSHTVRAAIPVLLRPQERGWYSADLHHHSDVLDGFTEPGFVVRSELASGVDLTFLSDHDAMVNNAEMRRLSARRGRPFIPAVELSPSWAHFNAYPIADGAEIGIDVGSSGVDAVFSEARRLGADVVALNHPYGDYGYFHSLERDAVPGGFNRGFDLVEITAGNNQQTMTRTWQLWNEGQRAYLAAGSDVHDVWNEVSGAARSYALIEGEPGVAGFIAALKQGRSYASQGPLIYPEIVFGSDLAHPANTPLRLAYEVSAVSGLGRVLLIEQGREIEVKRLDASETSARVEFVVQPGSNSWYSIVVEDAAGKYAYSNPVWVTIKK